MYTVGSVICSLNCQIILSTNYLVYNSFIQTDEKENFLMPDDNVISLYIYVMHIMLDYAT